MRFTYKSRDQHVIYHCNITTNFNYVTWITLTYINVHIYYLRSNISQLPMNTNMRGVIVD